MGDDATHHNHNPPRPPFANDDAAFTAKAPPTAAAALSTKRKASQNRILVVTVTSLDHQSFQLPWKAARHSGMIRHALGKEDDQDEDEEEVEDTGVVSVEQPPVVPIPKLTGSTLGKVVEFLKHLEQEEFQTISLPLAGRTLDEVGMRLVPWLLDFKGFSHSPMCSCVFFTPLVHDPRLVSQLCPGERGRCPNGLWPLGRGTLLGHLVLGATHEPPPYLCGTRRPVPTRGKYARNHPL